MRDHEVGVLKKSHHICKFGFQLFDIGLSEEESTNKRKYVWNEVKAYNKIYFLFFSWLFRALTVKKQLVFQFK
jgi:hypothetical protein